MTADRDTLQTESPREPEVIAAIPQVRPSSKGKASTPWPCHRPTCRLPLTWTVRGWLVLIAAVLIAVFAAAAWIHPYGPDGTPLRLATHRQLGLPPCNFVLLTGMPCPSCGMTTSFSLLVHGDLRASLRANWVGTLLALAAGVALPWTLLSALYGRLLLVPPGKADLLLTVALTLLLVLMLGRWIGLILLGEYF